MARSNKDMSSNKVRGGGKRMSKGLAKGAKLCETSNPKSNPKQARKKELQPVAAGSPKLRRSLRLKKAGLSDLAEAAEQQRLVEERRQAERLEAEREEAQRLAARLEQERRAEERRRVLEWRREQAEGRMAARAAVRRRWEDLERIRERIFGEDREMDEWRAAHPIEDNEGYADLFADVSFDFEAIREERFNGPDDTDGSSMVRNELSVVNEPSVRMGEIDMEVDNRDIIVSSDEEALADDSESQNDQNDHDRMDLSASLTVSATAVDQSTQEDITDQSDGSVLLNASAARKRSFESSNAERGGEPAPKRTSDGGIGSRRRSGMDEVSGLVMAAISPPRDTAFDYPIMDTTQGVRLDQDFGQGVGSDAGSDVAASPASQVASSAVSSGGSSVGRVGIVRHSSPGQRAPDVRAAVQAEHCSPSLYQTLAAFDGEDIRCLAQGAQDKWLTDSAVFLGLVHEAAEVNARGGRCSVLRPQAYREFAEGRTVPRAGIEDMMYFRDHPDIVLIPLHHGDGSKNSLDGHWALAVYSVKAAHVVVYDSVPPTPKVKRDRLKHLKKMLKALLPATEHQRLEFRYAYSCHVDRQLDGFNCGIHSIIHARRYLEGRRNLRCKQQEMNDFDAERDRLAEVMLGIKKVHETIDPNVVHQVLDLFGVQQHRRSPRNNTITNERIRRCLRKH